MRNAICASLQASNVSPQVVFFYFKFLSAILLTGVQFSSFCLRQTVKPIPQTTSFEKKINFSTQIASLSQVFCYIWTAGHADSSYRRRQLGCQMVEAVNNGL